MVSDEIRNTRIKETTKAKDRLSSRGLGALPAAGGDLYNHKTGGGLTFDLLVTTRRVTLEM